MVLDSYSTLPDPILPKVIGVRCFEPIFNQSQVILKRVLTVLLVAFSRLLRRLQVFALSPDWFIELSISSYCDWPERNYGFMAVSWK